MGHRSHKIDYYQIILDRRVKRIYYCSMTKARPSVYIKLSNRRGFIRCVSRGLCSEVCIKSGYKIGVIYSWYYNIGNALLLHFQRLKARIRKLNWKKILNLDLKWRWWKKSLQPKQTAQRRSICAIHWSSQRFSSLSSSIISMYTLWGYRTQRNTRSLEMLSSNNWLMFLLLFFPANEVKFLGTLTIS